MSATEPPPLPLRKRETFTAVDPEVENVVEEVHVDSQQASAAAAGAAAHEIESISNSKSTAKSDTLPITAMHYEAILRLLGLRHETPAQLKERLKREREEDDRYLSKLDQYVGPIRLRSDAIASDAKPEARIKPETAQYKRDGRIDWFGYGINSFAYHVLPPPPPVVPRPEFQVARLRSAASRLYGDAIPMWAPLFAELGAVIMWQRPTKTLMYSMLYTYITIKSCFTPVMLGYLVWRICKKRLFAPSMMSSISSTDQEGIDNQEAFEFVEEMFADGLAATGGAGGGLSTAAVTESVASTIRDQAKKAKKEEREEAKKAEKKGPTRREKFNAWKDANGPGLIVVLDDLADMHEKASNLCAWRDPKASTQTLAALLLGLVLCTFTPTLILLKGFQVFLGLLLFVIIPIAARQDRYDPLSFLLGPAPTDAEYATTILRRRREERDEELPSVLLKRSETASTISTEAGSITTSDKKSRKNVGIDSLKSTAKSGAHWLEQGRQIARGERELGLEVDGDSSNALGSLKIPGMASSVSLMAAYKQGAEPDSQTATFFAQCHSRPGTLFVGPSGLRFAYLVKPKAGTKEDPIDTEDIQLPHSDILEVTKTEKKLLTVQVSSGFTVETSKKETIAFPFVQNRDQAFNRILAFTS